MDTTSNGIPLYFITGFLGAGKTTLLNNVLDEATARGLRVGVIVNDWGQSSVDAAVLRATDIEIRELHNGQVFCGCLMGNFIDVLHRYTAMRLDAVVVETSGMADPLPLQRLLTDLREKTGDHYRYQGMTALVDPESFLDLVGVIKAVDEQIRASQRVLINKIDITAPEMVEEVRQKILALNPEARLFTTTFARLDEFFDSAEVVPTTPRAFGLEAAPEQAAYPRPGDYLVQTQSPLGADRARAFIKAILPDSLRVKAVLQDVDGAWYYADGVNSQVSVQVLDRASAPEEGARVVIIPRAGKDIYGSVKKAWKAHCATPFKIF